MLGIVPGIDYLIVSTYSIALSETLMKPMVLDDIRMRKALERFAIPRTNLFTFLLPQIILLSQ
jgi:hypothetical protein